MAVFRPKNNYVTDYEDTGFEPTIDEIIAQIVAPTPVATPVAQVEQKPSKATVIDNLTKQILAQGTTDKWTGEGKGSAEANARDMASILADTGITDISQFGEIKKTTPAYSYETEQGTVNVPEEVVTTYGNKETGQEVANTYGERQQGNAFGGTYTGSGNTGYRVDMSSGTPVFYTTEASSNDLFNLLSEDPILNAAATYAAFQFGGPAGVAALNAAQGKSAEDVAKATALAYAGGELSKAVSPYIPTPDTPIDFAGGTPEQINEALNSNFVKDLKAAGVGNVSEFINNVGGNASSFVPEEVIASNVAKDMASQGMSIGEINNQLVSVGYQPEAITTALQEAATVIPSAPIVSQPVAPVEAVQVSAPTAPPTVNDVISQIVTPVATQPPIETVQVNTQAQQPQTINDVISQIVAQQPVVTPVPEQTPFNGTITSPVETVQVTAPQAPVAPTIADVISSIVQTQVAPQPEQVVVTGELPKQPEQSVIPVVTPTATVPEVQVVGDRPITNEKPSSITEDTTPIPVITPSKPIDTTIPEKKYTTAEIVDMVRLGLAGAGLLAGANAASSGPKQYDIVPVPADWKSPVYQKDLPTIAPTQLPPIDFGNRNLLIGTQWEKFLDPNYGKIPAQKQFNQPTKMSYDRLMSILGTGRDVLPSQELTINDVISGIQNQYGQTS